MNQQKNKDSLINSGTDNGQVVVVGDKIRYQLN